MNKVYKINNNVFGFNCIYLDMQVEEAKNWIKKNRKHYDIEKYCDGVTYIDGNEIIIYLSDVSDYVLLHECIHAIQGVLSRKGIDTGYENTEILAYTTDWLYRQILLRYHKSRNNKKWVTYK